MSAPVELEALKETCYKACYEVDDKDGNTIVIGTRAFCARNLGMTSEQFDMKIKHHKKYEYDIRVVRRARMGAHKVPFYERLSKKQLTIVLGYVAGKIRQTDAAKMLGMNKSTMTKYKHEVERIADNSEEQKRMRNFLNML